MAPLRTLLVDVAPDRAALRQLLAAHADLPIVAEAGTFEEARDALAAGGIDALFLALALPGGDAFAILRCVPPGTRVILITSSGRPLMRALRGGPANYLPKPLTADALAAVLAHLRSDSAR